MPAGLVAAGVHLAERVHHRGVDVESAGVRQPLHGQDRESLGERRTTDASKVPAPRSYTSAAAAGPSRSPPASAK
ncbi:hypothetical protein ACFQ1L_27095 [Phytohabitans flavus]|uniref:hypothetical protein n=1 Tax=Phytohabitans flavus TaxID=1076124 RepID=UPI003633009F